MTRIAFLVLLMVPATVQAQNLAGTVQTAAKGNLPPGFYPASPCQKPDGKFLERPPTAPDIPAYNKKVQAYNQAAHTFNACVTAYAAQAQHDIETIRAAIAAAN